MSEPFIGEIRLFAGNFAPRGWALCAGRIMSIAQNTALFSLLGTSYGGDGLTTFALPDLQGRVPIGGGSGAGLTPRLVGEVGGSSSVSLLPTEIPAHTHTANCSSSQTTTQPEGAYWGSGGRGTSVYASAPSVNLAVNAASPAGGGTAHNNMQPYLGMTYIIALEGVFPSRS